MWEILPFHWLRRRKNPARRLPKLAFAGLEERDLSNSAKCDLSHHTRSHKPSTLPPFVFPLPRSPVMSPARISTRVAATRILSGDSSAAFVYSNRVSGRPRAVEGCSCTGACKPTTCECRLETLEVNCAPSGSRSLFSNGELFTDAEPWRIIECSTRCSCKGKCGNTVRVNSNVFAPALISPVTSSLQPGT